jgi:predicted RNA-binding protein with PIN domain
MPVLIDGNNLLHAAGATDLEIRSSRVGLCHALGEWAKKQKERVRIVFDGPPPRDAVLTQMAHCGVDVSFSGAGVSADAVLVELIRTDTAPRRLTVVSSDHEVQRPARRRRCRVEESDAFARSVAIELRRPAPAASESGEKPAGLTADELKLWLEAFAVDNDDDLPDEGPAGGRRPRR